MKCGHGKLHTNASIEVSRSPSPLDKPVFLTVHGLFADHVIWNTWNIELTCLAHQTYHLELPGRNHERRHTGGKNDLNDAIDAFEEAVRVLRAKHGNIILLCHSAGCAVATSSHSVRHWPEIRQVVLLNPSPLQLWDLPVRNITTCIKYAGAIAQNEAVEPKPQDLAKFLLPGYTRSENDDLVTLNESGGFMGDVILGIKPIRWPRTATLVISGKQDRMTPPSVAKKVATHLRAVTLNELADSGCDHELVMEHTFDDCGHLPMVGVGAEERLRAILRLTGQM